jgi:hypothetical protein
MIKETDVIVCLFERLDLAGDEASSSARKATRPAGRSKSMALPSRSSVLREGTLVGCVVGLIDREFGHGRGPEMALQFGAFEIC